MYFTRHHGLGNMFIIGMDDQIPDDAPDLARQLCEAKTGIGADGLIIGTPADIPSGGPSSFAVFNRDGSRAELSGNGLCCFGQAVGRATGISDFEFTVATDVGHRHISVAGTPTDPVVSVTVEMGQPGPGPEMGDLRVDLEGISHGRIATVNIGNPHLLVEVSDPASLDLAALGPALEAQFTPNGCNVHLVELLAPSRVFLRSWERGVGLTEACGTGACAAAYLARMWEDVGSMIEVVMPGGRAIVSVGETLLLSSSATFVDGHEIDRG